MKSILIVEDDNVTASSIKSILRNLGYQKTYIAESGVKALKIIEEKHPDLILADIVLEGKMSGIELAQQVKKKYSIPVIFITAYSDEGTVNKAKLAEPYGYITKPIQQKDLKIAVDIAFYKFKMEQKLKENEAKLKTILHTMPSGLFTIDLNRKITTWNKEAETITGLKAKETIGKHCLETLFCDECKKGCLLFDDDVDKPIYHKESVLHINEREIALLKNEDILKDLDGNIIGGIVSFIDITERKQMEQEIKESEEKYKTLYETTYDAIFVADSLNENIYSQMFRYSPFSIIIHDMEMNIIDANIKAVEEFDYPKEELLKKKVTDLHTVTELEHSSQILENMQKVNRMTVETSFMRKDGSVFNAEATPSKYKLGDKLLIHVLIQDITERKQAEEELLKHRENLEDLVSERTAELKNAMIKLEEEITERKKAEDELRTSEAQLSNAMEIAKLGYWEYDFDDDLFTFDDHFYDIFRTTAKKVGGYQMTPARYAKLFLHPDDMAVVGVEMKKALETTDPDFSRQLEHRIIYADGEVGYISVRFFIIKDGHGRTVKTYGANQDITERKQAENELRKEKRFTENIVATVPDSLLVIDKNLKIKSANHTFYEAFKMEPEKVIGASIINVLGNEAGILSTELNKLFGTDKMFENFELHYRSKIMESSRDDRRINSKGERIFIISVRDMLFESSEEELIILHDITERKISEEKLRKAYSQLEDTQQELIQSQTLAVLGEFASGIAHEIRNPLANISASAQYCINKFDLARKIKSYLRIIIRNSNKANKIIKDLLDFAKPSEFVFKQGNILRPLNRACDLIEAKRFNNNIRLYKRCSRVLPKILMDEKRMEQVFLNIIINSIDSMSKGGRLSITAYSEKEYVVINISDTGKGISTQDISKIFNPFFTKKSDGVGLGLSVTHRIIQSHKGKIEVESEYHKGTKFIIRLPIINNDK